MSAQSYDLIVVSQSGSGHWLAVKAQRSGMRTLLIDLTSARSQWSAEDLDGPFSVTRSSDFDSSYQDFLANHDFLHEIENGWTFMHASGVYESRGPLSRFHLQDRYNQKTLEKIYHYSSSPYYSAPSQLPQASFLEQGLSFYHRFSSRQGLERSLQWVKESGLDVYTQSQILDLGFDRQRKNYFSGLELSGDYKGLIHSNFLVWTISHQETLNLNPELAKKIFTSPLVEPDFVWVRYRYAATESKELTQMPLKVDWLLDLDAPLVHQNFMSVQKTANADRLDTWILIPFHLRHRTDYLKEKGELIRKELSQKFWRSKFELTALPRFAETSETELSPFPYVKWLPERFIKSQTPIKNVFIGLSHEAKSYATNDQYTHIKEIFEKVKTNWNTLMQNQAKERRL